MMRAGLLSLSFAVALLAQEPTAPAKPQPVALGDTGLSMVLPAGYELADGKPYGVRFLAMGPVHEGCPTSINLATGSATMPAKLDTEALTQEMVTSLKKMLTGYELVEHGSRTLLGKPTMWLSGRFAQGGLKMRNLQILVPTEPSFLVTFTTHEAAYADESQRLLTALTTLTGAGRKAATGPSKLVRRGARLVAAAEGFSLVPPTGWEEADPALVGGAFLVVKGEAVDGFAPNLNVRATAPVPKMDIAAYEKVLREELPKKLEKAVVQEVVACKVAGRQGARVRATYELPIGEVGMVQYTILGSEHTFIATFTVAKATLARWQPVIEKCAATMATEAVEPPAAAGGKDAAKDAGKDGREAAKPKKK